MTTSDSKRDAHRREARDERLVGPPRNDGPAGGADGGSREQSADREHDPCDEQRR